MVTDTLSESFDSLRAGKRIQSGQDSDATTTLVKFRFPSPGKVSPKSAWTTPDGVDLAVKFRFPSRGKAYPKRQAPCSGGRLRCFDSLPPGKRIQSPTKIQRQRHTDLYGFDSLRPGKCLQRCRDYRAPPDSRRFRFPSIGKVSPKIPYFTCKAKSLI